MPTTICCSANETTHKKRRKNTVRKQEHLLNKMFHLAIHYFITYAALGVARPSRKKDRSLQCKLAFFDTAGHL